MEVWGSLWGLVGFAVEGLGFRGLAFKVLVRLTEKASASKGSSCA